MAQLFTIAQLVRNELPTGFVVSEDYIAMNIKINQHLLYKQAEIDIANQYVEANWPDDWNILIGYLIVFGVYQTAIGGGILLNGSFSGSSNDGQVKKIVTGPTEVEWQDTAAAFSTLLKNLSLGQDSIFNLIISNACTMSRVLGIKIPFCKGLQIGAMFIKAGVPYCHTDFLNIITREVIVSNQTEII